VTERKKGIEMERAKPKARGCCWKLHMSEGGKLGIALIFVGEGYSAKGVTKTR